jgi:hypothetical protein
MFNYLYFIFVKVKILARHTSQTLLLNCIFDHNDCSHTTAPPIWRKSLDGQCFTVGSEIPDIDWTKYGVYYMQSFRNAFTEIISGSNTTRRIKTSHTGRQYGRRVWTKYCQKNLF